MTQYAQPLLRQEEAIYTQNSLQGKGAEDPEAKGLKIYVEGVQAGLFRVSFHETTTGKELRKFDVRSEEGYIGMPVPSFRNDIAFKFNLITAVTPKK